jgi:hypothetical protein
MNEISSDGLGDLKFQFSFDFKSQAMPPSLSLMDLTGETSRRHRNQIRWTLSGSLNSGGQAESPKVSVPFLVAYKHTKRGIYQMTDPVSGMHHHRYFLRKLLAPMRSASPTEVKAGILEAPIYQTAFQTPDTNEHCQDLKLKIDVLNLTSTQSIALVKIKLRQLVKITTPHRRDALIDSHFPILNDCPAPRYDLNSETVCSFVYSIEPKLKTLLNSTKTSSLCAVIEPTEKEQTIEHNQLVSSTIPTDSITEKSISVQVNYEIVVLVTVRDDSQTFARTHEFKVILPLFISYGDPKGINYLSFRFS